jgi:ubiquinone/menaquinone biosynthesis C-methylase UbiE
MRRYLLFALLLAIAPPLAAQMPAPVPAAPEPAFAGHPLDNPERGVIANRDGIVRALALAPGMVVADVGAGTGAFMAPISRAVGATGRYIGVDIDRDYVERMKARAKAAGLSNTRILLSKPGDTLLEPGSVDLVVVIDAYHHFDPPGAMNASMYRALKPGGRLVVVDFDRTADSPKWVKSHVRADRATFAREIERAGFRFEKDLAVPGLDGHFVAQFRKG